MDVKLALKRFKSLQTTSKKSDLIWKPEPGRSIVRIVPYKFNKDNPFIELYFHYNINNKTYLSPQSFGRPDPIVDFANKLKNTGDTEDWKAGKKMEPKLRTFVPVVVRGQEKDGVKFWGFGKTVYQDILGYIADPDYGDITDPLNGRDIALEVLTPEETGKSYPTTNIRVKPSTTKLSEDKEVFDKLLNDQKEITELYQELSYEELKTVLENWLNPSAASDESAEETEDEFDSFVSKSKPKSDSDDLPWDDDGNDKKSKPKATEKPKSVVDVANDFDKLFNNK